MALKVKHIKQEIVNEVFQAIENNAQRQNTQRAYRSDRKQYYQFTKGQDSQELQKAWLFSLASKGYKYTSIARKATAIDANSPEVKTFLKGLKNSLFDYNPQRVIEDQAPPILKPRLLKVVKELYDTYTKKALRDRLIIIIGWIACLRVSELVNIKIQDLTESDIGYILTITSSKNLDKGETFKKLLPYSSNIELCPVRALDIYFEKESDSDFLFTSYRKGDKPQENPLKEVAVQRLIKSLFGDEYSFHSLRAGFITEALEQGCTLSEVRNQSGHKSVTSLMRYDRIGLNTNASLKVI